MDFSPGNNKSLLHGPQDDIGLGGYRVTDPVVYNPLFFSPADFQWIPVIWTFLVSILDADFLLSLYNWYIYIFYLCPVHEVWPNFLTICSFGRQKRERVFPSFFVTKLSERHVVALQILCSFLASLPPAQGISCYSCLEYPGSSQTCSNPSIIQCGPYYDSCVAMNVTSNIMGIHSSAALKNCSISNHQCNASYVCGLVNSSISQSNGTLLSCSLNCCYGDLCNGQGGGGILSLSLFLSFFVMSSYNI